MSEQHQENGERYTYQEFLDKFFPNVGDLTKTCPHCGEDISDCRLKISPSWERFKYYNWKDNLKEYWGVWW